MKLWFLPNIVSNLKNSLTHCLTDVKDRVILACMSITFGELFWNVGTFSTILLLTFSTTKPLEDLYWYSSSRKPHL